MRICEECGKEFDPEDLDQVMFHCGGHVPVVVTGIVGKPVLNTDGDTSKIPEGD